MDLSIIMAYKSDNGGLRDKHLHWTLFRYKLMFPEAEIIISEDKQSNLSKDWEGFNKSRFINFGVKNATRNNLLITDIDVVLSKKTIEEGTRVAKDHSLVMPVFNLYRLTESTTMDILSKPPNINMPKIDLSKQSKLIREGTYPCGFHIITKEHYIQSGGYDERFVGWGREDNAFQRVVMTMVDKPYMRLDADVYHLWHPRNLKHNTEARNDDVKKELMDKYKRYTGNKEDMKGVIKQWI